MSADLNRRDVLAGTIALGALGRIETARAQPSAPASAQQQASRSMTSYIGSPTSRVDGRAKVTGQAKYAGEFNVSGLAYGSVVGSTITKGRIARIDAGEALKVRGVLGVLTHESRTRSVSDVEAIQIVNKGIEITVMEFLGRGIDHRDRIGSQCFP